MTAVLVIFLLSCGGLLLLVFCKPAVSVRGRRVSIFWTVPLAVCICLKYSRAAEADADGDPVEVLLHDRTLLGMAVAFAALVLALLYL